MNQGIKLPYSVSNFEDLVKNGYHYVDKTHYVEVLENMGERYFFYLRPRRFGKSLFISMLHHYYGLEYKDQFQELFGKYYIGQHPTPMASQYMVLEFEFTKITTVSEESTYNGFLERVRTGTKRFFAAYPNVFSVTEQKETLQKKVPADIMEEIVTLMLRKAPNRKLYVMIDEYDHFANELIAFRMEDFKNFVSKNGFVRKFYEGIKEGTHAGVVDRFFATGITPITLDSMTSGFNITTNLSLDLRMIETMGFTEDTVKELFELAIPHKKEEVSKFLPLMKEWYNGYKFDEDAPNKLYNPNMVLYFLSNFQTFGKAPKDLLDSNISSDYHKVRRLLTVETPEENHRILRKILDGEVVRGRITRQFSFERMFTKNDFLSLLFYNGFLTIDYSMGNLVHFCIPNYVIQKLYFDYFWEILQQKEQVKMKIDVIENAIFEMAFKGNPQSFFEAIHSILHQLANRDYQRFDEKYVKLLMLSTMMLTETYYVESEPETTEGYIDIYFLQRPTVPVNHQYVFELKYLKKENAKHCKAAQKAAKKQLLKYIDGSKRLRNLTNLQAWTVVVIKDELKVERVN